MSLEHYANEHAVSKFALNKPNLLRRVNALNKGKPLVKQIKPYSFALVGPATITGASGKPVVPLTSFTRKYSLAPYQSFIDANTGKLYEENTELYWKALDITVEEYIDHPESKFENAECCGTMHHTHLAADSIMYIGKANELEESELDQLMAGMRAKMSTYLQFLKETRARSGEAWKLGWMDIDPEIQAVSIAPKMKRKLLICAGL